MGTFIEKISKEKQSLLLYMRVELFKNKEIRAYNYSE
jgi:hypothetical protein